MKRPQMTRILTVVILCVVAGWAAMAGPMACVLGPSANAQAPRMSANVKITLLGTGSPAPSAERLGPCTLVEAGNERLLFDAGRGCAIRLAQARVPWRELTKVFLTHMHADHTFSLPDLFVTGWIGGRAVPLEVIGPSGTREMLTSMIHAINADIASRLRSVPTRQAPKYIATDVKPGVVYESLRYVPRKTGSKPERLSSTRLLELEGLGLAGLQSPKCATQPSIRRRAPPWQKTAQCGSSAMSFERRV
jgi:hypothetical protein